MTKKNSKLSTLIMAAFTCAVLATSLSAQEDESLTEAQRVGDPWPLSTCIVSGGSLGTMGEPVITLHEGREVRFCCAGCVGRFNASPEEYLALADAKIREQQEPLFPLDHCIIDTAEAIQEDEAENHYSVVGNRLFIYCCPPCDRTVRADPAPHFNTLNEAVIAQQSENYPLSTCIVSGQPLGDSPVLHVSNGRLLKLCCADCVAEFEKNPAEYLVRLAEGD